MRCGILFYSIGKLLGGSKQEDDVIRFAFLKDLTGCCVKNEKERGQVERHHRSQQGPGNERKVAWARVVVTEMARRGGSQASVLVGRGRNGRHHLEKHSLFQRQVTARIKHCKV